MIAALVVFSLVTVAQVPTPRPNGWVADQANVLSANAEAKLNTTIEALFQAQGIELAVVTVDDVHETPKQFATALFNHWGIGSAQTNTGVLVLLVMGKRRLEIETGTGIEAALPSAWLADMQARAMVPRFKQKDFAGGLVAGVQAIVDHLSAAPGESASAAPRGEYRDDGTVVAVAPAGGTPGSAMPPPSSPSHVAPVPEDDGPSTGALVGGGAGVVGAGGASAALLARRRRRQRTCMKCQPNRRMLPLSEVEDDAHLDAGQRKEEQLGSVDYEVVICRGCQDARVLRHNKWFSGHSRCSSCRYKTLHRSSSTIVAATYDHGGEVQIVEDCRHCNYHDSRIRYTSRLTPPSESSSSSSYSSSSDYSSSSSGFSGGSSSGGGAGSSW